MNRRKKPFIDSSFCFEALFKCSGSNNEVKIIYFTPVSLNNAEWIMVLDFSPTVILVWDGLFVTESGKRHSES